MVQQKLKRIQAYVAFIDLVGFKDLLNATNRLEKLDTIIETITERIAVDQKKHPDLNYLFVSDTIITWCETPHFSALVWKVCQIQNSILEKGGLLTRGALTHGEIDVLFEISNQSRRASLNLFGPAYLEAYELHDRAAKYPRVILSDAAAAAANVDQFDALTVENLIQTDRDGWQIIRQFGRQIHYSKFFPDKSSKWPKTSMSRLNSVIENGCNKYSKDATKREKWHWMLNHYTEEKRLFDAGVTKKRESKKL